MEKIAKKDQKGIFIEWTFSRTGAYIQFFRLLPQCKCLNQSKGLLNELIIPIDIKKKFQMDDSCCECYQNYKPESWININLIIEDIVQMSQLISAKKILTNFLFNDLVLMISDYLIMSNKLLNVL